MTLRRLIFNLSAEVNGSRPKLPRRRLPCYLIELIEILRMKPCGGFGTGLAYTKHGPDRVKQIGPAVETSKFNFDGGRHVGTEEILDQPAVSSKERHSGHASHTPESMPRAARPARAAVRAAVKAAVRARPAQYAGAVRGAVRRARVAARFARGQAPSAREPRWRHGRRVCVTRHKWGRRSCGPVSFVSTG